MSSSTDASRPARRAVLTDIVELGLLESSDGKSGSSLERLSSGGEQFVRKRISAEHDWIMRVSRDHSFRPLQLWEAGLLDELPECIDHATVEMRLVDGELALIMRDVGAWLVPPGDDPIPLQQHRRFLRHMAELHHRFLGFADDIGLLPLEHRYLIFTPPVIAAELARQEVHPVIGLMAQGWQRVDVLAPRLAALVRPLHEDVRPLVAALRQTPQTFLHGDWKLGNLGTGPDGRTILLDWAAPGQGPPCSDLAYYLALNAARLPEPKQDAIAAYRSALDALGVDTAEWFDRQLGLCLLAIVVLFGWEKALGSAAELAWWEAQALAAAELLPHA